MIVSKNMTTLFLDTAHNLHNLGKASRSNVILAAPLDRTVESYCKDEIDTHAKL